MLWGRCRMLGLKRWRIGRVIGDEWSILRSYWQLLAVCSNVDVWDRVIEGNSQNAYAEHHDDVYLLLHAQRETQQLWYRNSQDGNVEDDIDSSMRPGEDMEVDAFSGMLTVPARPDVGYW
jgi:hypothetical protein